MNNNLHVLHRRNTTITSFQDILDNNNVGMQIYCYLNPADISRLGSCSHHLRETIICNNNLSKICMHQLPLHLGARTNYLVDFCKGHSFSTKADLFEYVLGKTERANLVMAMADRQEQLQQQQTVTMEESRRKARELFLIGNDNDEFIVGSARSCAPFVSCNSSHPQQQAGGASQPTTITSVECYHQTQIEITSAKSWITYILDRDACKRSIKDKSTNQHVKSWLDCLISHHNNQQHQQTDNENGNCDIKFGMWRWSCKHTNLNGQGIVGVGVMIIVSTATRADGDAGDPANDTIMELRLTRMY